MGQWGKVVRSVSLFARPGAAYVSGGSVLPTPCGCTEPFKPLTASLAARSTGPIEATPVGDPTVLEIDTLRGVNDVLEVAVLGLEEVDSLPLVQRECDGSVRPDAHDEIRSEEPQDRPPESSVHFSPRRRSLGRVGPLRERTPVSAVEDARHRPAPSAASVPH